MVNRTRNRRPSDYVLLKRTQDYLAAAVDGKVSDPELIAPWRTFYTWYDPLIRRFVNSFGFARDIAEDVVQSAWQTVISELSKFDCNPDKGKFRAWLFLRVRSNSIRQIRLTQRSREHAAGINFDWCMAETLPPDRLFELQWNDIVLQEVLHVLERRVSDFDYKLFVMYHFHEMTVAELVDDCGICENTVRSKLRRMSNRLNDLVAERGYRELMFEFE